MGIINGKPVLRKDDIKLLVKTSGMTEMEVKEAFSNFIKDNPTYNVLMSNCQDYVNALTNFLMVEGERKGWLPETETYRQ